MLLHYGDNRGKLGRFANDFSRSLKRSSLAGIDEVKCYFACVCYELLLSEYLLQKNGGRGAEFRQIATAASRQKRKGGSKTYFQWNSTL